MKRGRVAFLYIAQPHQVLHNISAAVELHRLRPELEVEVLATSHATLAYARELLERLGDGAIPTRLLGPAWLRGPRHAAAPPPKLPMLAANLLRLAGYEAIVTPERTTVAVRRMGLRRQALIYTQHGAGDRGGTFEPRLRRFDLVFAAGAKYRDRMLRDGLTTPERCAVVGYPKFDVVDALDAPAPRLFAQDRPTVLYNPHFDPRISSWPRWGLEVLESFARSDRHNLIFAPHLRLFEHARPEVLAQLAPFHDHPGIHIDLGGRAAIDMTYTRMADAYLGDVSSQVYEFIRAPRACLFLNAHGVDWRSDESFRNFRFGPVLDSVEGLAAQVDLAWATASDFRAEQAAAFAETFDVQATSATVRAAEAIAAAIDRRR